MAFVNAFAGGGGHVVERAEGRQFVPVVVKLLDHHVNDVRQHVLGLGSLLSHRPQPLPSKLSQRAHVQVVPDLGHVLALHARGVVSLQIADGESSTITQRFRHMAHNALGNVAQRAKAAAVRKGFQVKHHRQADGRLLAQRLHEGQVVRGGREVQIQLAGCWVLLQSRIGSLVRCGHARCISNIEREVSSSGALPLHREARRPPAGRGYRRSGRGLRSAPMPPRPDRRHRIHRP